MNKKIFHLFILMSLIITPVWTQEVGDLTLEESLRLADQNNISLQIVRQGVELAAAGFVEARSAALPKLELAAEYVHLDDVAAFDMGGGVLEMGQEDNYEVSLQASQILFAGGGIVAGIKQADRLLEAAQAQVGHISSETAFGVHTLFNLVLLARQELEVARGDLELAQQNLLEVEARLKQGLATKFDQLRASEQVSRAEAGLLGAKNSLKVRRLDLLRALDLPLDDPRLVSGELEFVVEDQIPSDPVELALSNRFDYAKAQKAYQAQEEGLNRARSGWWPSLAAFGQYRYANPTREFEDDWEESWLAGVSFDFPVFDGLLTAGKCQREQARLRQADLARRDLNAAIRREVAVALSDLETATQVVYAREKNLAQAEEALRLARRGYQEGVQQQIDVIDAQLALTRSRHLYARAVYDHIMARTQLARSTGTLLPVAAADDYLDS